MTSHAQTKSDCAVHTDTPHLSCMVSVHGNMYRGRMIKPSSRPLQDYAVVEMDNTLKLFPISSLKFSKPSPVDDTLCPVTSTEPCAQKEEAQESAGRQEVEEEIDVTDVSGVQKDVKKSETSKKDENVIPARAKKQPRRRKAIDPKPSISNETPVTQTTKKALRNVCLRRKLNTGGLGAQNGKRQPVHPGALTSENSCHRAQQPTTRKVATKSTAPRSHRSDQHQRTSAFSPVNAVPVNPMNVRPQYRGRAPAIPSCRRFMNNPHSCTGPPMVCPPVGAPQWATNSHGQFYDALPNCNAMLSLRKQSPNAMQTSNPFAYRTHMAAPVVGHQCFRAAPVNSMVNLFDGYTRLLRTQAAAGTYVPHIGVSGTCQPMVHPSLFTQVDGRMWPPGPIWS